MSKYLVWVSESQGVYIRAHKVMEQDGKILFIRNTSSVDVIVATYNAKDIRYSKVE